MDNKKFTQIRRSLGKTQNQLSQLLCVSPKAIQSFEQGWRKIPASAERQLLMLLSLAKGREEKIRHSWEIKKCPPEWKDKCIVWEYKVDKYCWFFNGTCCQGVNHKRWEKKIALCWQCEVFHQAFPSM